MHEEGTTRQRARLGRALKRGIRDTYDHLGYVVFATFVSFLVTLGVVSLSALAARASGAKTFAQIPFLLPGIVVAWLCAVGVCYYANKAVYHEEPVPRDTWTGIRTLLGPALGLLALDLLVAAVLGVDAVVFLRVLAKGSPVFTALGVLCGYLLIVWLMMAMYHLPLLPAQLKMESGPSPLVIVRKSFLLMGDNPGFTVGLFVVIIAFAILCAVPGLLGMAMLCLGATAFLLTHALRELFAKYGIVEEEPDSVDEKPWRLPDSWRKRERPGAGSNDDTGGKIDG